MRPSTIRTRQPRGVPIGGQFATAVRKSSGLLLGDDPWGESSDPWGPFQDATEDAEREPDLNATADLVSLACLPAASAVVGAGDEQHRWAQAETDRRNKARREIDAQYGSLEQAACHLGSQVATRAEEIAGITAEQVRSSYQARLANAEEERRRAKEDHDLAVRSATASVGVDLDGLREEILRTRIEDRGQLRTNLNTALREIDALSADARRADTIAATRLPAIAYGMDDQTRTDLRRLADGYAAALAELRPLGGDMDFHEKSTKKARTAFADAAQVFPTDWIEASNDRTGKARNGTGILPVTTQEHAPWVKISSRRAHYMDYGHHRQKKKVAVERLTSSYGRLDMETYGRSSSPFCEYRRPTDEELAEHSGVDAGDPDLYIRTSYDVTYRHVQFQPGGRGWEEWTDPSDPDHKRWRRVAHRMKTVGSFGAPEITTNDGPVNVEGRSGTFATSVHELSHRFEYSVPGITALEQKFLIRRSTDPQTGEQAPLQRLRTGPREVARPGGFINEYMGREYPDSRALEVLSTGAEALFGGSYGGLVGAKKDTKDDGDMRNFVLGVLACAGRSGTPAQPHTSRV